MFWAHLTRVSTNWTDISQDVIFLFSHSCGCPLLSALISPLQLVLAAQSLTPDLCSLPCSFLARSAAWSGWPRSWSGCRTPRRPRPPWRRSSRWSPWGRRWGSWWARRLPEYEKRMITTQLLCHGTNMGCCKLWNRISQEFYQTVFVNKREDFGNWWQFGN